MKARRFNSRLFSLKDYCVALLLLAAFAASGWSLFNRGQSANFIAYSRSSAVPGTVSRKVPLRLHDAATTFVFDARFASSAPGQAVHAPSVVELRNGDLRAVWFSGSREGAGDVTIQTAVFDSSTLSWGSESTLFDRQKMAHGLWRYVKKLGNPVIARAPDGALWLWVVNVSMGGWAGSAISWARSVDDGTTWSAPRRLVTSPFLNISTLVKGAPVAMADGHLSLPVYHEFATKFGEILNIGPNGRVIDKTRIPNSHGSLQPVILVSGPESAQVYMRSGQGGKMTTSATQDAGKSWMPTRTTSQSNPDSAVAGLVDGSNGQWLALNPTLVGRDVLALLHADVGSTFDDALPFPVEPLVAAKGPLSRDAYASVLGGELKATGASDEKAQLYIASAQRQLCGAQSCAREFSYPYLLRTRDGFVHLIYTWNRARIKHVRFDPSQPVFAVKPAAHASALN